MIKVERFKPDHLYQIKEHVVRRSIQENAKQSALIRISDAPFSFTIKYNDKIVFCGGVHEYYPGRGEAWAVVHKDCRRVFLAIHRVVKRFLLACTVRRVEAVVDCSFKEGHRWASMLGFQLETKRMKEFGTSGEDCSMYVKFSEVV